MRATLHTTRDVSKPVFHGHVWTSESGAHAAVDLDSDSRTTYITFHDPATARALAAACTAAAEALDAEIASTGKAASHG